MVCTVWSGDAMGAGAPLQTGEITRCQGTLQGVMQQQGPGILRSQSGQLRSEGGLPAGPGPQEGPVLHAAKSRPMAHNRRQIVAHMAAGQQQQRHQGERLLAQRQLLRLRRRRSRKGLQPHGRATAALQLSRQGHQLGRQLAAGAAVHHQQQGLGGGGREAATKALRHLGIQLAKAQGHQGAAGSGQAGQQIHRRGRQLGVEVVGQGAETSHQLGPRPHRQATGNTFKSGAPQWGDDRGLHPAQQHGPSRNLALVTQQGQQG